MIQLEYLQEIMGQQIQSIASKERGLLRDELAGLFEAMKAFDLDHGTIVTLNQYDHFEQDGLRVEVVPAHEFIE